jgi:hypothetical protein
MAELKNARKENFARYMAEGMKQIDAYRLAVPTSQKWKDKTVYKRASEWYNTGEILGRIQEIQKQATSETIMTVTQRKEWLSEIIKNDGEETKDRLKAVDILNKMDGEYTEKVEVNGQINNPFSGLTTEELKKLVDDD